MSQSQSHEQESNHSLRVKFEEIQAMQEQHRRSQLVKKPSINYKLQKSHEYGESQFSESYGLQQEPQLSSMANFSSTQSKRKLGAQQQQRKSQISNFIIKTYRILEDKSNAQIIHWTDEGNAFIVKNKQKFQNEILPKYFKHKKFSSFVRQLNMYDFHKIRKEKEIPIFKHKYFKEGCVDLLSRIKRKSGDEVLGQGEDEQGGQQVGNVVFSDTRNYIPSLMELADKPMMSAMSFKSKSVLPYVGLLTSQPSLGLMPGIVDSEASQIELLIQENNELSAQIAQLTREEAGLEMEWEKRKEKVTKILGVLMSCDFSSKKEEQGGDVKKLDEYRFEGWSLRQLQSHFSSDDEPYSFSEYFTMLRTIYSRVRENVLGLGLQLDVQQGGL